MRTFRDAKAMAKAMKAALAEKELAISHSEALEIVARQFGVANWNILAAKIDGEKPDMGEIAFEQPIPIFRIFDEEKARGFYEGFLDCRVDWEHRFEPNTPLYMQVSRGGLKLHLSEHSGDASPGGTAVCTMKGVAALQRGLIAKNYRYNRPGLEKQEWGLECQVIDPFGNRIRFMEANDKE